MALISPSATSPGVVVHCGLPQVGQQTLLTGIFVALLLLGLLVSLVFVIFRTSVGPYAQDLCLTIGRRLLAFSGLDRSSGYFLALLGDIQDHPTVIKLRADLEASQVGANAYSEIRGYVIQVEKLIAKLDAKVARLTAKLAEKTSQVEDQDQLLECGRQAVNALFARQSELRAQAEEQKEQLQEAMAALEASRAEEARVKAELSASQDMVRTLTERVESLESTFVDKSDSLHVAQYDGQGTELMDNLDRLEANVYRCLGDIARKDSTIQALKTQSKANPCSCVCSCSDVVPATSAPHALIHSAGLIPSSASPDSDQTAAHFLGQVQQTDAELARAKRVLALIEAKERALADFAQIVEDRTNRWDGVLERVYVHVRDGSSSSASDVSVTLTDIRAARREVRVLRRDAGRKVSRLASPSTVASSQIAEHAPTVLCQDVSRSPRSSPAILPQGVEHSPVPCAPADVSQDVFGRVAAPTESCVAAVTVSQCILSLSAPRATGEALHFVETVVQRDEDVSGFGCPTQTSTPVSARGRRAMRMFTVDV
ncbi:hypothetical protein C8Q76DRAFT_756043 [Earliella scabrosa]|nr:hypothetical protein C8Q76DRAFT_756043 [Earliella scabrosa]